jgi:hypothetical protein
MTWCLLVLSLPTDNAAARMRAWRALKACGAAVLRDGVYVLPDTEAHRSQLREVAEDVRANEGTARVLVGAGGDASDAPIEPLFDRAADFAAVVTEARQAAAAASPTAPAEALRSARRLRKALDQLCAIDFFPGEAQRQAMEAVTEFEQRAARLDAPDEPHARAAGVPRVDAAAYSPVPGSSAASSTPPRALPGWPTPRPRPSAPSASTSTAPISRMWARASASRPCSPPSGWRHRHCSASAPWCTAWTRAA